ncbi:hypothetical protein DL769_006986 [Monosporascus sp. CRB-8-3]|nr:hypothetical protein DL769_006986 [Monosporascus sp. CRB-8-3]
MGIIRNLYDTIELGYFEWPFRNSHPTHPATVHFPLAFLTAAYSCDSIYGVAVRYGYLSKYLADISRFGYISHVLGVITSLPSMTSGAAEFWELYKTGGLNRKDKEQTNPKSHRDVVDSSVKIGIAHGLLNTAALGVSTYAAWSRRHVPNFTPGRMSMVLSMLTLPGLAVSAALGGELVYGKGVGVARMGHAKDEKVQGFEEYKEKKA